jgi:ATP-dependent RNA helicase TDRD9
MLDMGSPPEILALAMDPPNLENIASTVMFLKEIGALLPTVNGVAAEV